MKLGDSSRIFRTLKAGLISIISSARNKIEDAIIAHIMNIRFGRVNLRPGDLVRHRHHPREVILVIDIRPRHRASTLDVLILVGGETLWVMSSLLKKIDDR